MTVLFNAKTGEKSIIGQTVSNFAKAHGLCKNELYKLVNGRKPIYRNWMLQKTHDAAFSQIADADF